jgi:hypothetical protein
MARVYDAFDERLERRVALKILRPETGAMPGMRQRFQQEARIAAHLVHPNIVAILDYGEDDEFCFLVMERLSGSTLRDEIASAPLTKTRFLRVMSQTLAALGAAHRSGVLHRDIKPSNILLDDGRAKMADFGIAKSFDGRDGSPVATQDLTMTGIILGTPGYLAPERRAGHPATVQSDLYSVGAVMVEAVSGHRLEVGDDMARLLPPELLPIATRALAPDPRRRFASAQAMAEALGALETRPGSPRPADAEATRPLGTVTVPSRTEAATAPAFVRRPPAPPLRHVRRRSWRHVVLLAAFAVVVVGAAAYWLAVGTAQPTGPATSGGAATTTASTHAHATDPERGAIRTLAAQIAQGAMPGDQAMASALDATAAEKAGTRRQAAAEQALSLAQVLVNGNGISADQYQDIVNTLDATGAAVPTTTTSTTTTTTVPPPSLFEPFGGHGYHHGHGGDGGQG